MQIQMTIERILPDGSQLEPYTSTLHGWASVDEAVVGLCQRFGDRVVKLKNGYEDKHPCNATDIRKRVTFSEIA